MRLPVFVLRTAGNALPSDCSDFFLVYDLSRRRPRLLLLLPALQLLWVNLHGGTALLGWFLAGAFVLDQAWQLAAPRFALAAISVPQRALMAHGNFRRCNRRVFCQSQHDPGAVVWPAESEEPSSIKEFESLGTRIGLGVDLSIALFIAYAVLVAGLFVLRFRSVRNHEWLLFPLLLVLAATFFRFRSCSYSCLRRHWPGT